MNHKLYLSFLDLPEMNLVRNQIRLLCPEQTINSIDLASEQADQIIRNGIVKSAIILLVGAVSIAIKIALGASKSNISAEIFFENVLFIYVSNMILFITNPILARIVPQSSDFSFSWRVHLVLLVISTIVAIVMSVTLKNKAVKVSPSVLLKGE